MPSSRSQDLLVQQLIDSFHDYHTRIGSQLELVHAIVRAVRDDERERCAQLADEAGQSTLAGAIRGG